MLKLPGYQIITKIHDSSNSQVYRGLRESDRLPIILKFLKKDYPTVEEITRYKLEYEITHNLNLEGVVKSYSLEHYQNKLAIVFEDFGGQSIEQLIFAINLDLAEFLKLSIQITKILEKIHAAHIIHKDINPSNIILNRETQEIKLIDFGISTILSQEKLNFQNPNVLEGTLPYISPEQTGRMNRSLDYRTDFYSLGVTFYQMLTYQLPCESKDPLELIHHHIAIEPVPPHILNPQIPKIVSDLVMKLLAKTAENRYQSARGIITDLEYCLTQLNSSNKIEEFILAQKDVCVQFKISEKLYGRQEEIETLKDAFARVALEDVATRTSFPSLKSKIEIVLVSGYSGIGKSALIQEIYKPITQQGGHFIAGKFDQYQRHIPYVGIAQAFEELIRHLLTESEKSLNQWRDKILVALGVNGYVITQVIPVLELLIGSQAKVPDLPAIEAQNRFNFVFQNFIKVFMQPEHPLVIFLDDLQWADSASLKLIQSLMTTADSKYLLLIGAYRDNEVGDTHPLSITLDEIQKAGVVVTQIYLSGLSLSDINQLIADTLQCSPERTQSLAELVQLKTEGNPFFINEFLKSLYSERLFEFDLQTGVWQWSIEQIQAKGITDNVVALMVGKIEKLSQNVQQILKLAACVGNQFAIEILASAAKKSQREIVVSLHEAIAAGLIIPLSNAYKSIELNIILPDNAPAIVYKFAHDRIQQAAYSLNSESEYQLTHLKIGQLFLQQISEEQAEQKIFDIVNHLNLGRPLITSQAQKDELAQLNFTAAQKAKAATAYDSALRYSQVALELLPDNSWLTQYNLTLELHNLAAEVAYLNGELEQMEQYATLLVEQAKTLLDRVKVYEVKMQAYAGQTQFFKSLQVGLQALNLIGINFPEKPTPADIQLALSETTSKLDGKQIKDLLDLPPMTDRRILATMDILSGSISGAYIAVPELFPLIVLKQVNLSIEYGNTHSSPFAYAMYGLILCGAIFDIESGYQFGQLALNLLQKIDAKPIQAKTLLVVNTNVEPWKVHVKDTLKPLQQAHQIGINNGDLEYAGYSAANRSYYSYFSGRELRELKRDLSGYIQVLSQLKQFRNVDALEMYLQVVLNLSSTSSHPEKLIGIYNESTRLPLLQKANDRHGLFHFYLNKLILCYWFNALPQAMENATLAEQYLDGVLGLALVTNFYFYDSLVRLMLYPKLSDLEQTEIMRRVAANQEKMQLWAHHAPMNYLHKFCLVKAEQHRVLGEASQAIDEYDRAIELAKANAYINEEALAEELTAKFYLSQGKFIIAKAYMQEARYGYLRWGATAKVRQLESGYPEFFMDLSSKISNNQTLPTTGSKSLTELDISSVFKASQAVSSEIVLDTLVAKLMKIAIENAGAEKGYLFLKKRGKWVLEAEELVQYDDNYVLQSMELEALPETFLPKSIINYVSHTRENVILSDARVEGNFTQDRYIQNHQPKSILCTPIINQGKLIGILYLENSLTTGVFQSDREAFPIENSPNSSSENRLTVLNILTSQAAISIENAILYSNLEKANQQLEEYSRTLEVKVEARTKELKKAKEVAEAANRAKTDFFANMSHELRTPLHAILGFTQMLTRHSVNNQQHQEYLSIINRSGEHLLALINDVLEMSKIEAGKSTLTIKTFDLYQLLNFVKEMFQVRAENKGINLIFEQSLDLPQYIESDEQKLRQVLINILGNAVKFTDEGYIKLKAKKSYKSPTGGESEAYLLFSIEDTGYGIAPNEINSVFEAFVQTENGRKLQQGTGLGLSISQQFVRLMGGDITVRSILDRGTIFQFDIGVRLAGTPHIPSKKLTRRVIGLAPNQPIYRILVADDRWENRQLMIKLLELLKFEIREATNGQEAIAFWESWEPHLILMDLRMPIIDGYEATKKIKSHLKGQSAIIIALTASVFEEDRSFVLSIGCDDFIRKPFQEEVLFEKLAQYLGIHYLYEEPAELFTPQQPASKELMAEALAVMPQEWISFLHQAATKLNSKQIFQAIEQIPGQYTFLTQALTHLANNFRYDVIIDLTERKLRNE